jgi:SAM-dependent methyltransferase
MYGDYPEEQIDKIRKDKKNTADMFDSHLRFEKKDVVIDLGSGPGFVSRWIAPSVSKVWCLDISKEFHEFCKMELAQFPNVECRLIPSGNLSCIYNKNVNKVFSTGVFIHFNFYDLLIYFREIYKLLGSGGLFAFDFADAELLNIDSPPSYFSDALKEFIENRSGILGLMNWNGGTVVCNLAQQIGFRVLKTDSVCNPPCSFVLLEKP